MQIDSIEELKRLAGIISGTSTDSQTMPVNDVSDVIDADAIVFDVPLAEDETEQDDWANSVEGSEREEEYDGETSSNVDTSLRRYMGARGDHVVIDEAIIADQLRESYKSFAPSNAGLEIVRYAINEALTISENHEKANAEIKAVLREYDVKSKNDLTALTSIQLKSLMEDLAAISQMYTLTPLNESTDEVQTNDMFEEMESRGFTIEAQYADGSLVESLDSVDCSKDVTITFTKGDMVESLILDECGNPVTIDGDNINEVMEMCSDELDESEETVEHSNKYTNYSDQQLRDIMDKNNGTTDGVIKRELVDIGKELARRNLHESVSTMVSKNLPFSTLCKNLKSAYNMMEMIDPTLRSDKHICHVYESFMNKPKLLKKKISEGDKMAKAQMIQYQLANDAKAAGKLVEYVTVSPKMINESVEVNSLARFAERYVL